MSTFNEGLSKVSAFPPVEFEIGGIIARAILDISRTDPEISELRKARYPFASIFFKSRVIFYFPAKISQVFLIFLLSTSIVFWFGFYFLDALHSPIFASY
jgi:hypothetical protein